MDDEGQLLWTELRGLREDVKEVVRELRAEITATRAQADRILWWLLGAMLVVNSTVVGIVLGT